MRQDDDPRPMTLGQRLDRMGGRIAARHLVRRPWVAGVAPVVERATRMAALSGRFARVEVDPPADPSVAGQAGFEGDPAVLPPVIGGGPGLGGPPKPEAEQGPRQAGSPPAAAPGRGLPPDVRDRLRDAAGPATDVLRVHTGAAADAAARAHHADAVAIGTDVHLRGGAPPPDSPAGVGLLAHEAVHVAAALDPERAGRRQHGGAATEEAAALAQEAHVRAAAGPPAPGLGAGAPVRWGAARPLPTRGGEVADARPPSAVAAAVPMAASVDRDTPAPQAGFDLAALRRMLFADLMRQLRSEFERGA
jgi:hypothetical protein